LAACVWFQSNQFFLDRFEANAAWWQLELNGVEAGWLMLQKVGEFVGADLISRRQDHQPFNDVLQLPDIAGPSICREIWG
jgi:hypothetical protein